MEMEVINKNLKKKITAIPPLLGVTEVGLKLGWDRRKVHIYWKRGHLPEPAIYVGSRPFWMVEQINQWEEMKGKVDPS